MIGVAFLLLLFGFGALSVLARARARPPRVGFRQLYEISVSGVLAASFCSVVLLEIGLFGLFSLTLALALCCFLLFGLRFSIIRENFAGAAISLQPSWRHFVLLAVLIGAAFLRFPAANYLAGGQDQGVYINMANHFAETGEVFVHDKLPELLRGNSRLQEFYDKHSLSGLHQRDHIPFARELLPGLYFQPEDSSIFVPQFYHLHPLWMAISNLIFGASNTAFVLLPFSLLAILSVYLLANTLARSSVVGLMSAALLAANPAHSYFAKFPVSETIAGAFVLAAFYFFAKSRERDAYYLTFSALAFGAAFFTRISGFMILCCLIPALAIRICQLRDSRRSRLLQFSWALVGLYGWSFFHGLAYSFPYSRHIYFENLKITGDIYYAGSIFLLCCSLIPAAAFSLSRWNAKPLRQIWISLARRRNYLAFAALVLLTAAAAYKGYQLGFTDTYASHPYFGKRWRLAAKGFDSLYRFNPVVLLRFLTPLGGLFFFVGFYCFLKRSFFSRALMLVSALMLTLLSFHILRNFVAGNYYYYTRYLCSELLPLAVICSAFGFWITVRRLPRAAKTLLTFLFLGFTLVPSTVRALGHVGSADMEGFYDSMSGLNRLMPEEAVVILDRRGMPYETIALPLILSFQRPVIIYRFDELLRAHHMNRAFSYLVEKGHPVYMISAQTGWTKMPFFEHIHRAIVPQKRLQHTKGKTFPSWEYSKQKPALRLHLYRFNPTQEPAAKPEPKLDDRITVGAHYYLWHPEHFKEGDYLRAKLVPPQEPELGKYSSNDVSVIEQHISWASQHGIDFFTLDYWPDLPQYHSRIDTAFLKAKNIGDIKFCIFYESQDLRYIQRWGATAFTEEEVERFAADIEKFSERYFDHPSYLKINGKPVVVLYLTRTYAKYYEKAIGRAREVARAKGFELYLIGDEIFWDVTQERRDENSFRVKSTRPQLERIKLFDAITSYNLYTRRYKRHRGYEGLKQFVIDSRKLFQKYIDAVPPTMPVIPVVLPGYNDRAIEDRKNHAMPRTLAPGAAEGGFLALGIEELAKPLLHPDLNMFFVTSWNEWMEDTSIEPVKPSAPTARDISESGDFYTEGYNYRGYGMAYLETIRDHVVAASGRVLDQNGQPASGVSVVAYRNGAAAAATYSHSDGYFTLSRLRMPPGEYIIGTSRANMTKVQVEENKTVTGLNLLQVQPTPQTN